MTRAARRSQNEVWFRELNERLEEKALARTGLAERFDIVCECAREECTERLSIDFADYEAVRESATEFIVAHGHADASVEEVVGRTPGYDIVSKFGEAAEIAEAQNPRD